MTMSERWDELEQLCQAALAEGSAVTEQRTAATAARESFQPLIDSVTAHAVTLDAPGALRLVRERLLAGAASLHETTFEYELERLSVLTWPAAADPRPDLARARGEYRVEVWIGLSEQGRPRVRVVGDRRLEATLPAPREKFLDALLRCIRAPLFVPYPEPAADQEPVPAVNGQTLDPDAPAPVPPPEATTEPEQAPPPPPADGASPPTEPAGPSGC